MSELITEQLCALFDGELPPDQVELLLKRLENDCALQETWCRYQMMRDVLRQRRVVCDYSALRCGLDRAVGSPISEFAVSGDGAGCEAFSGVVGDVASPAVGSSGSGAGARAVSPVLHKWAISAVAMVLVGLFTGWIVNITMDEGGFLSARSSTFATAEAPHATVDAPVSTGVQGEELSELAVSSRGETLAGRVEDGRSLAAAAVARSGGDEPPAIDDWQRLPPDVQRRFSEYLINYETDYAAGRMTGMTPGFIRVVAHQR